LTSSIGSTGYGKERNWLDPNASGPLYRDRDHEHLSSLLVEVNGEAAGTMRLVCDSRPCLRVEQFMSLVDAKRDRRTVECQGLMVGSLELQKIASSAAAPFGLLPCMVKATLHFRLQNGITHVVADLFTDTDTTPMCSLEQLGFMRIGEPFIDHELTESSPSVALMLEISNLMARIFGTKGALERYLVVHDEHLQIYE
jgi:hypothetical protein